MTGCVNRIRVIGHRERTFYLTEVFCDIFIVFVS